jgi:hypothetical protein
MEPASVEAVLRRVGGEGWKAISFIMSGCEGGRADVRASLVVGGGSAIWFDGVDGQYEFEVASKAADEVWIRIE